MTNNGTFLSVVLLTGCLAVSASGQTGLLGGAGTYSRDGWKFSCSYVAKPPLLPGQHLSIQGNTEVMHTNATDGNPVVFHRFLTDPASKTYWGYDVVVEPTGERGSAILRFQPFSLRADQLPKEYQAAEFRSLGVPEFPSQTFQSGQMIAIDLLINPRTGQKIVDYIQVTFEPTGEVPGNAAARDFQVADVLLHVVAPSLRVNDTEVPPAIVADMAINRGLVWLAVPGRGRFLLALSPQIGYAFQKAGLANGRLLTFSWNGDRYELRTRRAITESSGAWNVYVLAAPAAAARHVAPEFSFGAVDSVEQFLSKAQ
jgi:hypothetical protein